MDAKFLGSHLQYFSSSGKLLSNEQTSLLCNSMTIAKNNNKFSKILFWGKIEGTKADYLIAQGIDANDELNGRKVLYSIDGADWHNLQLPDAKTQDDAMQIRGRFMGDPSHEYEQHDFFRIGSGETRQDESITIQVKEEARLATVIAKIDAEAMIVPRGAFLRSPAGTVSSNESFTGLSLEKSQNLENWLVFSGPVKLPQKNLLEQADASAPIDFLDTADMSVPVGGSWSVQVERGPGVDASLVKMRSLQWPGAEAAHIPNTKQFSKVYLGNGIKNIDLPFMLPKSKNA